MQRVGAKQVVASFLTYTDLEDLEAGYSVEEMSARKAVRENFVKEVVSAFKRNADIGNPFTAGTIYYSKDKLKVEIKGTVFEDDPDIDLKERQMENKADTFLRKLREIFEDTTGARVTFFSMSNVEFKKQGTLANGVGPANTRVVFATKIEGDFRFENKALTEAEARKFIMALHPLEKANKLTISHFGYNHL